jgi:hypothetical protein
LYFLTKFRRSDEFFPNFCENSQDVGVSTVPGISAALGVVVVACVIAVACTSANECVPDVASIFAAAGVSAVVVPAVYNVFAVASFLDDPGVPILL